VPAERLGTRDQRSPRVPGMVEYEKRGRIAVLTINRPEAKNAVNGVVAQGIEAGIDQAEEDDEVFVVVLTGQKDVFCAGADLKEINAGNGAALNTERGGFGGFVQRERSKPVIAAVEGPALAGGTEIVLACDMVVASREARFGIPEVKRNLVAAAGGLFRLPKVLPLPIAMELALTGDGFDAVLAERHGLVNQLTEPGGALDGALALAERVAANAPLAVRETRKLMLRADELSVDEGIRESGRALIGLTTTEDFTEGLTAFIEKREPQWKGR
jgi:enoyl-CoA hydratase